MDIYQYGRWEDDTFVLTKPITFVDVNGAHTVQKLIWGPITANAVTEGVTRDDAVHVMLSAILEQQGVVASETDPHTGMTITHIDGTCKHCGKATYPEDDPSPFLCSPCKKEGRT